MESSKVSEGSKRVPFMFENITRCLCMECPVQAKSRCAQEREKKLEEIIKSEEKKLPKPEEMAKLYCSGGRTSCKDTDFEQMCICGQCPVWDEYGLANARPTMYYCRDGKAQ